MISALKILLIYLYELQNKQLNNMVMKIISRQTNILIRTYSANKIKYCRQKKGLVPEDG